MDNQIFSPDDFLTPEIKDNQYTSQLKKRLSRPIANRVYTLVYSTRTSEGGQKP
jgi:hypothetical protein